MDTLIRKLKESGQLLTVDREVDPLYELAAVTRSSQKRDNSALLFNNVMGTKFPVVTNLYGSRQRLCEIIGAGSESFCKRWNEILDSCESGAAKAGRVIERPSNLLRGKLSDLPLITYHDLDAGPYLTSGIFLAKDPDNATPNLSFHRCMYVSDDEIRIRLGSSHDLADYQLRAEARDEPIEAAILIGVAPSLFMAAATSLPARDDELALAAAIDGFLHESYRAVSINLDIPASAGIIIEGRILPGIRRPEGPFGEFMGFYVPEEDNHVFEVTEVYWREGAVFHSLLCGSPEDLSVLESVTAAKTYRHLTAQLPGIIDVSCSPAFLNTTVKIKPQYEGHAKEVIMAAFDAHQDYNKAVFVVDEDVEIGDMNAVIHDFLTKGRADKRVIVLEDVPGFYRDPHKDHWGRLGVDCTAPYGREGDFVRKLVPGAEDIDLDDYVG